MSEFIKKFWRDRLGIAPGDMFTDRGGREWRIDDIHQLTMPYGGRSISLNSYMLVYSSLYDSEHGELYDIYRTVNWNKTKLYNAKGDILGRCKRNYLENAALLSYEPFFTPKRHKIKYYMVRIPGEANSIVKYTPKEFQERFDVIEPFLELGGE